MLPSLRSICWLPDWSANKHTIKYSKLYFKIDRHLAYVTRPHDWRIRSAVENPVGKNVLQTLSEVIKRKCY